MTASDHLGQQFEEHYVPITEFRNYKANDFDQISGYEGTTVGDLHRNFHRAYEGYKWDELHHDVAKSGRMDPLHVEFPGNTSYHGFEETGRLWNGHHRAVVAMESGKMFVPVSDRDTSQPSYYRGGFGAQRQRSAGNKNPIPSPQVHPLQGRLFSNERGF